ncbi:class D sortase [Jeotgalibacillus haloalkalitolerans]|uniref:Class D sortase n=1 Tax=Jeotgalibacillus haloalkalitolerans TaxID=3104292 RepID=A0ABU5KJI3_9BACL|nr:class D sortase [Jeotgalibacillus sp. HH7-29]MDZ5711414.1 class D sortase [Jeotgalibacillus sp. HH7-29]
MDSRNARRTRKLRLKKSIFLLFGVGLISFGFWFASSNAFPLIKGYYLYKTSAESHQVSEIKAENVVKDDRLSTRKAENPIDEPLYPEVPEIGDHMGELIIPKLDVSLPIYHGTDEDELEKGVGHYAGSVLPGEQDNSVLAGHRDTVFRRLGEVGEDDLLTVVTEAGSFTYKVRKVRIVDEDDRSIIVPKPKATLTLSTCYPFDAIGYTTERYILIADLIKSER